MCFQTSVEGEEGGKERENECEGDLAELAFDTARPAKVDSPDREAGK